VFEGASVVPCDFSAGMLEVGKRARPWLPFVAGDATRLPFADRTFDAVTISFGLRNMHDYPRGLAEMLRVTKPGGRLVVYEFSRPTHPAFRKRGRSRRLGCGEPRVDDRRAGVRCRRRS
jgi:demethylmenaquinone methyltransferase / 2-methoxy-6-polyprenyl-1,4-benzoquinol methylase